VADGVNLPRHLAHIEMEATAAPPGNGPTALRRQLELLNLACALGGAEEIREKAEGVLRLFASANVHEVDVLGKVWERIEFGRELYGVWNPAGEKRDLRRERDEEVFDGLVYSAQLALLMEDLA
jgi:hypothetical protein